jgi:competence protein ComEC
MRAKRARALSRDTSKSVRDTPLARLGSQSPGCSTAASSSAFWHAECSPGSVDIIVTVGVALVGGGLVPVAPLPTLLAVVLAFLVLRLSTKPPSAILLMVAMLVLLANAGRAWRTLSSHEVRRDAVATVVPAPARCSGRGHVDESPVLAHGSLRWLAVLDSLECDDPRSRALRHGPVRATLYGGPASLARGDEVSIIAQLARPQRFWNDETGDPRPGDARRKAVLSGSVLDLRIDAYGHSPAAWMDRVRARVRARIEATFLPEAAPMARALVLGESDLADSDDADFRASGLSHLLAVSGMHLVLVVASFVKIAQALLLRVPPIAARVDAGRIVACVSIPLVWIYADFAGGGGSTVRAAWMMSAALAARAIGRRSTAPRAFAVSLLAMGASDPLVVHDVSFLLSAGATMGLIALSRPLAARVSAWIPTEPPRLARAGSWLATTTAATVAATLPSAPILARFAPTLPAGGVFANLLAVPLGESVALPICLLHAALSAFPLAERGCAAVATGALTVVRAIAHGFAHTEWMLIQVPPPDGWQCACLAVIFLVLVTPSAVRRKALVALTLATLLLEVNVCRAGRPTGLLRVTFLDVGQGDSALVDLPNGEALILDGGGLVGSPVDTGTRVVAPVLRARRRSSLLAAVLSHPHPDHFTGLASGLGAVRLGALWDTGQGEREQVGGGYAALLMHARAAKVPVLRPDRLCGGRAMGGVWVEVLAPCPDATVDRGPNDNSLVIRMTYGLRTFLFVGDAEAEEERDLVALGGTRLHADVLKVGHHGSRTSSSPAFIAAVSPRDAIISAGVRNRFGHPHPATVRTLTEKRVHVFRTDQDGEVTASTDGVRMDVRAIGGERRQDLW